MGDHSLGCTTEIVKFSGSSENSNENRSGILCLTERGTSGGEMLYLRERGTINTEGRVISPGTLAALRNPNDPNPLPLLETLNLEVDPGTCGELVVGSPDSLSSTNCSLSLNLADCSNISIGGTQAVSVDKEDNGGHIIARSKDEIQRGIDGMIRTKAFLKVIHNIQKGQSWTVITGCPGEGKTTLGYFVMNYFQGKGFDVYIIKTKEEYFSIEEFRSNTVLMLNDIFGAFAFDLASLNYWLLVLGDIETLSKGITNFHVIVTMRNYVLKTALQHLDRFSSLFDSKDVVLDLTASVPLVKEEKKAILRCHLTREQIQLEQEQTTVEKICDLPSVHGFPHCCQMFANLKSVRKDPIEFFSRPLMFLNNTVRKLIQNEKVRKLFYAILYNNGSLPKTETKGNEFITKMTRDEILVASHELVGSYLVEHHNTLFVSHPSIMLSLVYVIGCLDPVFLLKVCPLNFITELVTLPSPSKDTKAESSESTPTIEIKYERIGTLLDRFVKEIESNNLQPVLSHQAFSCKRFAQQFLSLLTQKHNLQKILALRDRTSAKPFIQLATGNKSENLLKLITEESPFSEDAQRHAFLGCCECGSSKALRFLTEEYPNLDMSVVDENNRTSLLLAAQSGNKDIVELLMPKVGHTVKDMMGMNALHCSLEKGQTEVACFLVENGMCVNEADSIGRSPLHYAAWGGHQDIVCVLLENGANVNITDKDRATALHDACFRGFGEVTNTLIKAGSDVNKRNDWKESPLCIAVTHGHEEVVRCLLRSGCDTNLKNGKDQTAEDIAEKYGHQEIVYLLQRHMAKQKAST